MQTEFELVMPSIEHRQLGELNCQLVIPEEDPSKIAIFCHGFGAPGDDLVPLGHHLASLDSKLTENYLFIFPEAPISLADQGMPGGRAWWPLDIMQMQRAIEMGEIRDLRRDSPPQLPTARTALLSVIETILKETKLTISDMVLGGFSQGSMLATDVALHLDEKPGGLVIWSGTLLNEENWRPKAASLKDVTIVQSHGLQDPILPFEAATWLKDMLIENGVTVNFIEFPGMHAIPPDAINAAAKLLINQLSE